MQETHLHVGTSQVGRGVSRIVTNGQIRLRTREENKRKARSVRCPVSTNNLKRQLTLEGASQELKYCLLAIFISSSSGNRASGCLVSGVILLLTENDPDEEEEDVPARQTLLWKVEGVEKVYWVTSRVT